MFLVEERIWKVFLETGNVEAYLLLKQLEEKEEAKESVDKKQDEQLN